MVLWPRFVLSYCGKYLRSDVSPYISFPFRKWNDTKRQMQLSMRNKIIFRLEKTIIAIGSQFTFIFLIQFYISENCWVGHNTCCCLEASIYVKQWVSVDFFVLILAVYFSHMLVSVSVKVTTAIDIMQTYYGKN